MIFVTLATCSTVNIFYPCTDASLRSIRSRISHCNVELLWAHAPLNRSTGARTFPRRPGSLCFRDKIYCEWEFKLFLLIRNMAHKHFTEILQNPEESIFWFFWWRMLSVFLQIYWKCLPLELTFIGLCCLLWFRWTFDIAYRHVNSCGRKKFCTELVRFLHIPVLWVSTDSDLIKSRESGSGLLALISWSEDRANIAVKPT